MLPADRQVRDFSDRFDLTGAILYRTCEPCKLCLAAPMWDRIVFAATATDAEKAGFDDAEFHDDLTADPDVWVDELNHRFHDRSDEPFDAWDAKENSVPD